MGNFTLLQGCFTSLQGDFVPLQGNKAFLQGMLTKCNFNKVEEINDPDDGLIWKWELKRPHQ
jgi:hypothetical protein